MKWVATQWLALTNPYASTNVERYSALDNMRFHDETRHVRSWHRLVDRLERIFLVRLACVVVPLIGVFIASFAMINALIDWLGRAIPVLQAAGLL